MKIKFLIFFALLNAGQQPAVAQWDNGNIIYNSRNIFPQKAAKPTAQQIEAKKLKIKNGEIVYKTPELKGSKREVTEKIIRELRSINDQRISFYYMDKGDEVIFINEKSFQRLKLNFPALGFDKDGRINSIEFDDLKKIDIEKMPTNPRHSPLFLSNPQSQPPPPSKWRVKDKYLQAHARDQQSSCGSCATFAAVAIMESSRAKRGKRDVDDFNISEQMILNCSSNNCDGGWPSEALSYAWWANPNNLFNKPLPRESARPYVAETQSCNVNNMAHNYWANEHGSFSTDAASLKRGLMLRGPLAVCIRTNDDFSDYWGMSSVINLGDSNNPNHCIELLGWDNSKSAWLVRNSWGDEWGINGIGWISFQSKIHTADWVKMRVPGD